MLPVLFQSVHTLSSIFSWCCSEISLYNFESNPEDTQWRLNLSTYRTPFWAIDLRTTHEGNAGCMEELLNIWQGHSVLQAEVGVPAVWRVPFDQHPGVDQDHRLLAEEYPGRSGDALSRCQSEVAESWDMGYKTTRRATCIESWGRVGCFLHRKRIPTGCCQSLWKQCGVR
jgi:hypothetical protein